MRTTFETLDASAQPGRAVNPRCVSFSIFELKKSTPKLPLAQAIAFFTTELLKSRKGYPAQLRMQHDFIRCVLRFCRLLLKGTNTYGDKLISLWPTRTQKWSGAYWQRAKRKNLKTFLHGEPNLERIRLKRILRTTPDRITITWRIAREKRVALMQSYGLVTTDEFGFPWCSRVQLHAGLCCADRRRPTLSFCGHSTKKIYPFLSVHRSGCA